MRIPGLLAGAVLSLWCCALHAAEGAVIGQAELVRRSQVLYDAVAPGDTAPWKAWLADDAIFVDELGHTMNKAAYLAQLHPLPAGYGGSIKVVNAESRFAPNVAILTYDGDESETVFGQVLHARYHMTDTWLYRHRKWQIVASQTLRYYEDPAAAVANPANLDDYVGTYELAPGKRITVTRVQNHLFSRKGDGQPTELLPESPDLFFRAGAEGRRLFRRDSTGRVDALIDRRNNEDLLWTKVQ